MRSVAKWLVVSLIVGAVCGLVGSLFHIGVQYATSTREAHDWLLFLMPAAGVIIALIYRFLKIEGKGTNDIISSIQRGDRVPVTLAPAIFVSTVLTHMTGGSAGREGAALQLGGSMGGWLGRLFRLGDKDMRIITLCGMSAVFAALFGTPLTATLFALEVISVGIMHYAAFLPCLISSLTAAGIALLFHLEPTAFSLAAIPFEPLTLLKAAAVAAICALVSIVFCELLHFSEHFFAKKLKSPILRAIIGAAVIIAATLALGTRDYNGAGGAAIAAAINEGHAVPLAFALKMLFTVVTIASGYKGGEIVPTFFIGATLGCVLGPLFGLDPRFAAALGLIAMFCGCVNCPITSMILSVELFGQVCGGTMIYFTLACGIAYLLSGYFSLYSTQKIVYAKERAEFIDRYAGRH